MKKGFDPRRLDVRRFAEEEGALQGEPPLREFARLLAETEGRGADSLVRWAARGELRSAGRNAQAWLQLEASASLPLVCQRCLAPVEVPVAVDRPFRFAPDEATAAAEDDEADEDVLAESHAFNLLELVEDELLLALPVVPRHMVCPVLPSFSAGDPEFDEAEGRKPNPFAVLQSLKPGKH